MINLKKFMSSIAFFFTFSVVPPFQTKSHSPNRWPNFRHWHLWTKLYSRTNPAPIPNQGRRSGNLCSRYSAGHSQCWVSGSGRTSSGFSLEQSPGIWPNLRASSIRIDHRRPADRCEQFDLKK